MTKFRLVVDADGWYTVQKYVMPQTIDPYWTYVEKTGTFKRDVAEKNFEFILKNPEGVEIIKEAEV